MLRHIIPITLAMTACASLIPVKANAFTLTVSPPFGSEILKKPGDSVNFIVTLDLGSASGESFFVQYFDLLYDYDKKELLFKSLKPASETGATNVTTPIATITFDVLNPERDGAADVFNARVSYRELRPGKVPGTFETSPTSQTVNASGGDVVPVPEPLTIFGTATAAFGYGAILKRKYSKNTES